MQIIAKAAPAFLAAACGVTLLAAGPAQGKPLETVTVEVRASASAAAIHAQLVAAAQKICDPHELPGVRARRAVERCVAATVADAVSRSGDAALQTHHAQLSPPATAIALVD